MSMCPCVHVCTLVTMSMCPCMHTCTPVTMSMYTCVHMCTPVAMSMCTCVHVCTRRRAHLWSCFFFVSHTNTSSLPHPLRNDICFPAMYQCHRTRFCKLLLFAYWEGPSMLCMCGGQKTAFRSLFSPSTSGVPRANSGRGSVCLYLLSCSLILVLGFLR